ncbi:MAG TPA: hypothetical protein VFV05_09500 [Methylomirabilota bacterium]|nr:hypothetical protein [Methylomirabilota bacterium]
MAISTNVNNMLMETYEDPRDILFSDTKEITPLFAACESGQDRSGMGRKFIERVTWSEGTAVSADGDTADTIAGDGAAGSTPGQDRWEITPVTLDSSFVMTRDDLDATDGMSSREQYDVLSKYIDMAMKRLRNKLCEQVGGTGSGALCQISAITSTTVTVPIVYVNKFRVGSRLTAATAESGGTAYGTAIRVTAINTSTGVLTLSADPTSTWANNSALYLFDSGNRGAVITGVRGWIDPNGATLFGMTRAGNPALSGFGVDCSTLDTTQGLIKTANQSFYNGHKPDLMIVTGRTWEILQADKDAAKNVVPVKIGDYEIGYEAFRLATVFGFIPVLPDAFWGALNPTSAGQYAICGPFMSKEDRPKLKHTNKALITIDDKDGNIIRAQSGRKYGGRVYFRGQLSFAHSVGKYTLGTGLPS